MITKMSQSALAHPPMSLLRKMSKNTWNRMMIQMKKRKNHNMDQKTWPVPNSLASNIDYSL